MVLHVLFEYSIGYALFRVVEFEDVGNSIRQVEEASNNASKFTSAVKMVAFRPFANAAESLSNANAISEGIMTDELEAFLASNNFSKGSSNDALGVSCPVLGQSIKEATGVTVKHTGIIPEIIRGIKMFLTKYISGLTLASRSQAELALGHAYSRSKVKFNVNRVDNMIIQGIAINDQMDKDVNTFAMRMREWYSYHFPELARIVDDHRQYARLVVLIKDRSNLNEEMLPQVTEIVMDENKAQDILDASRMSMGTDISELDMQNILSFADCLKGLSNFRLGMTGYLHNTIENVAPNVGKIIGDQLTARLISKAGSLINLAKMPACTVQILGAEKALFRAIKTKSATPKYGMLYNASYLGKASKTDKGRISRCLANKVALASKLDCFSETLTSTFGELLAEQVNDRLTFYETGAIPRKNLEVMAEAQAKHSVCVKKINKAAKRKLSEMNETTINGRDETLNGNVKSAKKKSKKDKKSRKSIACLEDVKNEVVTENENDDAVENRKEEEAATEGGEQGTEKKKKQKKHKRQSV